MDKHVGSLYICEQCDHRFNRVFGHGLKCPACGAWYVRKFRVSDLTTVQTVTIEGKHQPLVTLVRNDEGV